MVNNKTHWSIVLTRFTFPFESREFDKKGIKVFTVLCNVYVGINHKQFLSIKLDAKSVTSKKGR